MGALGTPPGALHRNFEENGASRTKDRYSGWAPCGASCPCGQAAPSVSEHVREALRPIHCPVAAADDHCLPVTQHRAVCSTTSVWGWAELHDELSFSLSRAGSKAGNSTLSSLDPTSGPHPAPQRLSKAPSRRPKIFGGVSGSLGAMTRSGGALLLH